MSALSSVLRRYEATMRVGPIVWGETDCLHMVAECADAVRGLDRALPSAHDAADKKGAPEGARSKEGPRSGFVSLIPAYRTEPGALRALRKRGWRDLAEMLDAHGTRIGACRAMPGDVALLDQPPIGALGIVIGPTAVFLAPPDGFVRAPIASLSLWRL